MKELLHGFSTTPPLWKNQQFGIQQFLFPTVDLHTVRPFELPNNLRLGHQMEVVFQELIVASKKYKLTFSNLLVNEGKIRLGELDFILKNLENKTYLHIELAYKFYIVDPTKSEPIYRLIGPNKRDMFYTKLDKLKEKQFPLLHHPELEKYWETIGIDSNEVAQQCCFKAQLFEPFDKNTSIRPLNADCFSGKWIRFDDFNSKAFNPAQYYIPRKLEWVIRPHENVLWLNHFETLMEVNLRMVKENSPMLWVKRPDGLLEKLFVVWW